MAQAEVIRGFYRFGSSCTSITSSASACIEIFRPIFLAPLFFIPPPASTAAAAQLGEEGDSLGFL